MVRVTIEQPTYFHFACCGEGAFVVVNQTHLKLLLVDDNSDDALCFRAILSEGEMFLCDLETASSLLEGRKLIENGVYDACFLAFHADIHEHLQMLEAARVAGFQSPIIVLFDEDDKADSYAARRAAEISADDYLIKGRFDAALLERTLRYAIERRSHVEELRAAQTRTSLLVSAINCSTAGIVITDPNQRDNPIIYSNPGFHHLTGYAREEILGRNCRFLHGPLTNPRVREQIRQAIAGRIEFSDTILNYRKDGSTFWNDLKINPVFNAEGKLDYYVGVQTDITQRIESQTLRNRMAAIVESSADAIYSRDFNGLITSWNRGAEELFEYSCEEMIGQSVLRIMAPELTEEMQKAQHHIKAGYSLHDIESTGFCKSGERVYLSLSLAPIRDEQGEVTEIAVVARDVSERKRHLNELEESSKRIIDIWETINDGYFALDDDGHFAYMNHRAETMLRQSGRDILGKKIWDVFPDAINSEFQRKYREIRDTGRSVHFEEFHQALNIWLEIHAYPSKDGIAVYFRDVSERKRAQTSIEELNDKLRQRVERLSVLHQIDLAISGSFDVKLTLAVLISRLVKQLGVDAARVWLIGDSTMSLELTTQFGFDTLDTKHAVLRMGEGLTGRVARERRAVQASTSTRADGNQTIAGDFNFYYGLALAAKGELLGVIEVFAREELSPDAEWVEFLEAMAAQATIAIDNSLLFSKLQRSNIDLFLAYDTTIEGWSRALDLRDKETEGHSLRVTEMTMQLGSAMGIHDSEMMHIRRGALLHDIGKMGVPDSILLKPGALSEDEWILMKKHPVYAYELLSPIEFLRPALDIPYSHHEKWDGSGYPRGIRGDQIPLCARLFAIVDVWDALTSHRPYRAAWTPERARELITQQSGIHFDPEVVEVFLRFIA